MTIFFPKNTETQEHKKLQTYRLSWNNQQSVHWDCLYFLNTTVLPTTSSHENKLEVRRATGTALINYWNWSTKWSLMKSPSTVGNLLMMWFDYLVWLPMIAWSEHWSLLNYQKNWSTCRRAMKEGHLAPCFSSTNRKHLLMIWTQLRGNSTSSQQSRPSNWYSQDFVHIL